MKPAYVIGRYQVVANDSRTDALDQVLLFPAFRDSDEADRPAIVRANVSSRQLDRLGELSLARLATPLTRQGYEEHKDGEGFVARADTSIRIVSDKPNDNIDVSRRMPPAEDVNSWRVRRMTASLLADGIRIKFAGGGVMLDPETIARYNVAAYAQYLAKLFGLEPVSLS